MFYENIVVFLFFFYADQALNVFAMCFFDSFPQSYRFFPTSKYQFSFQFENGSSFHGLESLVSSGITEALWRIYHLKKGV